MKDLTDKPFGVNIAQAFVADPTVIVEFVIAQGVKFVTTSAGSPTKYTAQLKDGGLTVFHVVPTLRAAEKAVDAGVDGLIVEGGEGGGFKNPRPGVDHGPAALGDQGLRSPGHRRRRLPRRAHHGRRPGPRGRGRPVGHGHGLLHRVAGPRRLEAGHHRGRRDRHRLSEQPLLARPAGPAHPLQRTPRGRPHQQRHGLLRLACPTSTSAATSTPGIALGGQVAGRITASRPVADIIGDCVSECEEILRALAEKYVDH